MDCGSHTSLKMDDFRIVERPFRHFYIKEILSPQLENEILNWFENKALWLDKYNPALYHLQQIDIQEDKLPFELKFLLSNKFLDPLKAFMSSVFSADIANEIRVSAHKMFRPDDIILNHTDFREGRHDFRLTISFTPKSYAGQGGILILFDKNHQAELSLRNAYYPPLSRSCVGFEVSPSSFHAVSPVNCGIRYSLCFLFTAE